MATQRAVVKFLLLDNVQARWMFTANVLPVGGDTAEVLWDAYLNIFQADITDIMSDTVQFTSYELQEYSGGTWNTFAEPSVSWAGTMGYKQAPNQIAPVLIGKAVGKYHLGRKFLSGIMENALEGNVLDPANIATVVATLADYITPVTGIGGGTLTPGVLDKTGTFHAFVGGFVSTFLGTMRRRRPGYGI